MIETHDDRRRHQYPPVAVESKKGKRTEDMEMCFNSPSAQVHKKRGHQHLRDRDNVASPRLAGVRGSEVNRQRSDRAAKENRSDNMRVKVAARASPCAGGKQKRCDNARQPLQNHQPRKEMIGALVVFLFRFRQMHGGAAAQIRGLS